MVSSGVTKPPYFPSALVRGGSVWEEGGGDLILEIVWSGFAPEDEFASAARHCTAQLSSGIVEPGCGPPPRRDLYTAHTWGKEANAAAGRVSFFADYFSNLIYFIIVGCGVA